jgi:hypothetical protein
MKTPEEILEEMEIVGEGSFGVSLFVGFEDSSIILELYRRTEVLPDGCVVSALSSAVRALIIRS